MNTERKLILYIAMSLDGFIATENGNLDFLSIVENGDEDYGYNQFVNSVDTVILGRKTYDKVLTLVDEFPHQDKDVYVITRQNQEAKNNIHFYTDDLQTLVNKLKSEPGKNIYCDGGAEIVNLLLKQNLIDEMIISVIPILLGNGIKLFNNQLQETKIHLLSSKAFEKGLVQLHYSILK